MPRWVNETVATALGGERRLDAVLPRTGGPAGNARLTALTGMILLALFLVELVTLLDLDGLVDWHIAVGALLVPPALLKTGSTGWRIVRYYTRHHLYRRAGPPPTPLRLLGPFVVLGTLAVLGSGIALAVEGPVAGRLPFADVLGHPLSAFAVHQAMFVLWAVVTGLHFLARIAPAVLILSPTPWRLPGGAARLALLVLTLAVAALAGIVVLRLSGAWSSPLAHHRH